MKCVMKYREQESGHNNGNNNIPIPKKGDPRECGNNRTIALITHASKVLLKVMQRRIEPYMQRELAAEQAGFRKGRGTRDQIANLR